MKHRHYFALLCGLMAIIWMSFSRDSFFGKGFFYAIDCSFGAIENLIDICPPHPDAELTTVSGNCTGSFDLCFFITSKK